MHATTCDCPSCRSRGGQQFETLGFDVEALRRTGSAIAPFRVVPQSEAPVWETERGRRLAPPRSTRAKPRRPARAEPPRQKPRRRPAARGVWPGSIYVADAVPSLDRLAPGSEFVRWVQSALNRLSGVGLLVDGVMNAATRSALRSFQRRTGLPVDGIVGPDTEQSLRRARPPAAAASTTEPQREPEPEPDAEPEPDPDPDPAQDQNEVDEVDEFETLEFESSASMPTLRQGARGSAVADLQRRLTAQGFSPGAADSIFGSQTGAAVRSLQSARGLGVDGIVGPQTWGALLGTAPAIPGGGVGLDLWVLPSAVVAAGDSQYVRYDSPPAWTGIPGNCSGDFTAGAQTLQKYIRATFPGVSSIGGYSCRANTANRSQTSVHGVGRALDIMIAMIGGKANGSVGDRIANWLVQNAHSIGVQYIIWNRVRWNGSYASGRKVAPYGGPVPHTDHIHVEINNAAAARTTAWFRGR